MRLSMFAPSARLARYVSVFRVVEAAEETTRVLVPDGEVTLGIRFGGAASLVENGGTRRLPDASFALLRSTARHMFTSAGGAIVLAAFHPGGASRFFRRAFHEMFGATLELDQFLARSEISRAQSQVAEARTNAERVQVLERLLVERMQPDEIDPVVSAAIRAICVRRGRIRISELVRSVDVRLDPLEKRFRRVVGASPKQLASILRLRHAVDSYRPGTNLARLALDSGYADQSHFIRDFRRVMGDSPQRFFRSSAHC